MNLRFVSGTWTLVSTGSGQGESIIPSWTDRGEVFGPVCRAGWVKQEVVSKESWVERGNDSGLSKPPTSPQVLLPVPSTLPSVLTSTVTLVLYVVPLLRTRGRLPLLGPLFSPEDSLL